MDVSYHVAVDEVIYLKSHSYLQNTPKKLDAQTNAPYKNNVLVRQDMEDECICTF